MESSSIIKMRVLLDHTDDIFRDIEIDSSDTFESLHKTIQSAFGFDAQQMASFYMSNEDWDKGREITLVDMGFDETNPPLVMEKTSLDELIHCSGQKLVYVFDFMLMWCFFIDIMEISDSKKSSSEVLPCCFRSYGTAPDQYSKQPDTPIADESLGGILAPGEDVNVEDDIFKEFDDFEQYS